MTASFHIGQTDPRHRIAWLCGPLHFGIGGTWKHLTNWARIIDPERFDTTLIFAPGNPAEADAIRCHFESFGRIRAIPAEGLYPVRHWMSAGLRSLARLLAQVQPTLLHTLFLPCDAAGVLMRRLFGIPVHISSWESDPRYWLDASWKAPLNRLVFRLCRRRIDHFIVLTERMRRQAVDEFDIAASAVSLIPSGIYINTNISLCGGGGRETVIGTLGRLSPEKKPEVVIQAFRELAAGYPRLRLVVAGDGPERDRLVALAHSLGIADRVEFPGWCHDVPALLARLDLFVFTSEAEGLPHAVLEALAGGIPTIASAVGGVPDVIADGENGLLLRSNTPGELATHLRTLLGHPNRARAMATAGKRTVETRFRIEDERIRLQSLYLRLLARSGADYPPSGLAARRGTG
ncbi:MAG TPA: glycosyltransferase [Candidatus Ozemobacteraceae bacterium]|nr:glycosyltransferase [Candidatus Ozemobacteraceae bacterium]